MSDVAPKRILTLDGSGLHALSVLTVLDTLCTSIAVQNNLPRKPAPYELFDVIGGVGMVGCIALALGKYCLDIESCKELYFQLAEGLDSHPSSRRAKKNSTKYMYEQADLTRFIENFLAEEGLGSCMLEEQSMDKHTEDRRRCQHAFVAAPLGRPEGSENQYWLFRTYETHSRPTLPGPKASACKVTEAFSATVASKYWFAPKRIGEHQFFDANFPQPHNISSLAIDEALDVFGVNSPIEVVINVGPGTPGPREIEELKRRTSFPSKEDPIPQRTLRKIKEIVQKLPWARKVGMRSKSRDPEGMRSPRTETPNDFTLSRSQSGLTTSSSESDSSRASQCESELEKQNKQRLEKLYPGSGGQRYFHLGTAAARGGYTNDVAEIKLAREETKKIIEQNRDLFQQAAAQFNSVTLVN